MSSTGSMVVAVPSLIIHAKEKSRQLGLMEKLPQLEFLT